MEPQLEVRFLNIWLLKEYFYFDKFEQSVVLDKYGGVFCVNFLGEQKRRGY